MVQSTRITLCRICSSSITPYICAISRLSSRRQLLCYRLILTLMYLRLPPPLLRRRHHACHSPFLFVSENSSPIRARLSIFPTATMTMTASARASFNRHKDYSHHHSHIINAAFLYTCTYRTPWQVWIEDGCLRAMVSSFRSFRRGRLLTP